MDTRPVAREYYFHRFYDFQPDLNTHHPAVRQEILRIMGFWLRARRVRVPHGRGAVSDRAQGRRRAAHRATTNCCTRCATSCSGAAATRCCWPKRTCRPTRASSISASDGDRLQMMLNFPVNQRLFYALASGDIEPLVERAASDLRRPHGGAVGQVPPQPRRARSRPPDRRPARSACSTRSRRTSTMRLYDRGIRRRLAPMLDNDRRRHRAGVQPAVHPARHADACGTATRLASATTCRCRSARRADADAVVGGSAWRILHRARGRSGR